MSVVALVIAPSIANEARIAEYNQQKETEIRVVELVSSSFTEDKGLVIDKVPKETISCLIEGKEIVKGDSVVKEKIDS